MSKASDEHPASLFLHFQECFNRNVSRDLFADAPTATVLFQFITQICKHDVTDYVCAYVCKKALKGVDEAMQTNAEQIGADKHHDDPDAKRAKTDEESSDDDDGPGAGAGAGAGACKKGAGKKGKGKRRPSVLPPAPVVNPTGNIDEELKRLTDYISELEQRLIECDKVKQQVIKAKKPANPQEWAAILNASELVKENSRLKLQAKELMNHITKLLKGTMQVGHVDLMRSVKTVTGLQSQNQDFNTFLHKFKQDFQQKRPDLEAARTIIQEVKESFKNTMVPQAGDTSATGGSFGSYYY